MVRPKDLRLPFSWNQRKAVILNKVWFAPMRDSSFIFPGWEAIFENSSAPCIEYCSGNGDWIVQKALQNPEKNWVACERRLDRVKKIWSKRENFGCFNLLIIWGEAVFVTRSFFPGAALSDVYINFPDPWPKRRHANNRIIRPEFVTELARCMQKKSLLTIVTDDTTYSERMSQDLLANTCFTSLIDPPYYTQVVPGYGTSFFDTLFRSQLKEIRQLRFIRNDHG
jgi:tRNA (guanine-N7-)-methyltransferase